MSISKWLTSRELSFYCGVLGFELTQRYGSSAAFVSAAATTTTSDSIPGKCRRFGAAARNDRALSSGGALSHTRLPGRRPEESRLAGIPLDGASDHGVSEALYLRDPDNNGVELYWDPPKDLWPRTPDGALAMYTRRLDLHSLLRELPVQPPEAAIPEVGSGPRDLA